MAQKQIAANALRDKRKGFVVTARVCRRTCVATSVFAAELCCLLAWPTPFYCAGMNNTFLSINFVATRYWSLIVAILALAGVTTAQAEDKWSSFEDIGQGVSVSYCQVSKTMWTWKFRNDQQTTITYLAFTYSDKDGAHRDIFPGSLAGGKAFGGWAAFTASSRPTIRTVPTREVDARASPKSSRYWRHDE